MLVSGRVNSLFCPVEKLPPSALASVPELSAETASVPYSIRKKWREDQSLFVSGLFVAFAWCTV